MFLLLLFQLVCFRSILCSELDTSIEELVAAINSAEEEIVKSSNYPNHEITGDGEVFDFVIVGAGSAGCVLANRLTEIDNWKALSKPLLKVLLIEAGDNPPIDAEAPALVGSLQASAADWNYTTEPEDNVSLSHVNGSCRWPRGKTLGGTSVINSMWYVRGNSRDYDEWGEGWRYEDVLPYFKKSEDQRSPLVLSSKNALKYHSVGGHLTVENWVTLGNPLSSWLKKAFTQMGVPFNEDYNGKSQGGFAWTQGTLRDHRRCHSAKAYLTPAMNRDNLKISKNCLVTKILINTTDLTAYGVEVMNSSGHTFQVRASKEVILSAGVINSPQLLMLSGIGPKEHLEDLNITVVKDSPEVGKHLQDHPTIVQVLKLSKSPFPESPINASIKSTFEFLLKGDNPLSLSAIDGLDCVAFINTSSSHGFPYLAVGHFYFEKNQSDSLRGFLVGTSFNDEVTDQLVELNKRYFIVFFEIFLIRTFSKGELFLKDSNPQTHPSIYTHYFKDSRDLPLLMETFEIFKKFVATQEMKRLGASLYEIKIADCEQYVNVTSEYQECWIRHIVTTGYHPSGTCGMGRVVDSSLKVKGVNRLRVVDASVMSQLPSANLNAPVTMLAEKASDNIKNDSLTSSQSLQ